jgi:hypothetical protein
MMKVLMPRTTTMMNKALLFHTRLQQHQSSMTMDHRSMTVVEVVELETMLSLAALADEMRAKEMENALYCCDSRFFCGFAMFFALLLFFFWCSHSHVLISFVMESDTILVEMKGNGPRYAFVVCVKCRRCFCASHVCRYKKMEKTIYAACSVRQIAKRVHEKITRQFCFK